MLMVVKNQCKVLLLSVKYNIMREMTNRVTFLTNVIFMILNNATFIIQWLLLFTLKEDIGGYDLKAVMVLWGLAASTFGLGHIFFQRAYHLPHLIIEGKLDSFLVQPKNVLLGVISSGTNTSAIGDLIYGYLVMIIFDFSLRNLLLFTYFTIMGAVILVSYAVITGSICFWIVRGDMFTENLNSLLINFSTYPDGVFKGAVRFLLYTLVPVGMVVYLPLNIIVHFNLFYVFVVTGFTLLIVLLAFIIFYRGIKRYTSSSLMSARI
jgi:ABC-2 type transport system permease protein